MCRAEAMADSDASARLAGIHLDALQTQVARPGRDGGAEYSPIVPPPAGGRPDVLRFVTEQIKS